MGFDPSSASEVKDTFDPNTANEFDPSTAKEESKFSLPTWGEFKEGIIGSAKQFYGTSKEIQSGLASQMGLESLAKYHAKDAEKLVEEGKEQSNKSALGSLVGSIPTFMYQPTIMAVNKYQSLLDQGVDEATAKKAAGIDFGIGAAMTALPVGKTLPKGILLGAAGGAGGYAASQYTTQQLLDQYKQIQPYYDISFDEAVKQGLLGAAFGGTLAKLTGKKQVKITSEEKIIPKGKVNEQLPLEFDPNSAIPLQINEKDIINPYSPKGNEVWRVDEYGMPVREDLTQEIANVGDNGLFSPNNIESTRLNNEAPLGASPYRKDTNIPSEIIAPDWETFGGESIRNRIEHTPDEINQNIGQWESVAEIPPQQRGLDLYDMRPDLEFKLNSPQIEPPSSFFDVRKIRSNNVTQPKGFPTQLSLGLKEIKTPTQNITITPQEFGFGENKTKSILVEAKDPITGERRGVIDFSIDKDGNLQAENTKVAKKYQGQGIAQSMYQAAKDAGYDIVPGRTQTEAGTAMVKALQKKGIIKEGNTTSLSDYLDSQLNTRPFVPKGQAGFINFNIFGKKRAPEEVNAINAERRNPNPDVTKNTPLYLSTPDIDPSVVRDLSNVAQKSLQYSIGKDPVLALDTFFKKVHNAVQSTFPDYYRDIAPRTISDNLFGRVIAKQKVNNDAVGLQLKQIPNAELGTIINDMNAAARQGRDLPSGTNKFVDSYRAATKKILEGINAERTKQGIPPISFREGYIPTSRKGEYYSLVRDKDGNVIGNFDAKSRADLSNMQEDIQALLAKEGYTDYSITHHQKNELKYLDDLETNQFYGGGSNWNPMTSATKEYTGALGVMDLPAKYSVPIARDAIMQYFKNGYEHLSYLKARGEMQPLLDAYKEEGNHPNTYAYIQRHLNDLSNGSITAEWAKQAEKTLIKASNKLGRMAGVTVPSNFFRASNANISKTFYALKVLPTVNQFIQGIVSPILQGLPSMSSMKARFGLSDANISASFGKGLGELVLGTDNAKWYSKFLYEQGILDPSMHMEEFKAPGIATSFEKVFDKIGETFTKPDQVAKLHMALAFDNMLKSEIPNLNERSTLVAQELRRATPDMQKWNRPMLPRQAGFLNPMTASLTNYWSFALNHFANTMLLAAKEKKYAPVALATLSGLFLAGARGSMPTAAADSLIELYNSITQAQPGEDVEKLSDKFTRYNPFEAGSIESKAWQAFTYGVPSTVTGYDLSSAVKAPEITQAPGAPFAWINTVGKPVIDYLKSGTRNDAVRFVNAILPPSAKNMVQKYLQERQGTPEYILPGKTLGGTVPSGKDTRDQSWLEAASGLETIKSRTNQSLTSEKMREIKQADKQVDNIQRKMLDGLLMKNNTEFINATSDLVKYSEKMKDPEVNSHINKLISKFVDSQMTQEQMSLLDTNTRNVLITLKLYADAKGNRESQ